MLLPVLSEASDDIDIDKDFCQVATRCGDKTKCDGFNGILVFSCLADGKLRMYVTIDLNFGAYRWIVSPSVFSKRGINHLPSIISKYDVVA